MLFRGAEPTDKHNPKIDYIYLSLYDSKRTSILYI